MEFYSNKKIEITKISELFQKSFNQSFNQDYWEWRFLKNPNSSETFIAYVEEGDLIAAYYAVSPCILSIKNRGEFNVALSNMTMTHPDFQGKGYFKKLAASLYDLLKSKKFIGVYGFANQNSHYGFRKYLNWVDLAELNNFEVLRENYRSNLISRNLDVKIDLQKTSTALLKKLATFYYNDKNISILRDYTNLNWRFIENPLNQYYTICVEADKFEIVLIFKTYFDSIDIMEIFCSEENQELKEKHLFIAFDYLFSIGKSKINIWTNIHSDEHLYLEKFGFKKNNFSTYFGFIPFTNNFDEVLDLKNWHFRFCDSDVY